jgi:hypothetical protein
MGKNPYPDLDEHLDHFSESLETVFGFTILKSLMQIRNLFDRGSGLEKFGSGINIPDPQHWNI